MELTVISLFAGCGGSSLGYHLAGYKELLAVDFDKNAVESFKLNFDVPIWQRDIKDITGKEILKFCNIKPGELDVLDGSPPCQGFSLANCRNKRNPKDTRNDLFYEYSRLVNELQPKVFVAENVTGMVKGKMKGNFINILKELKSLNYNVKCKQMNSKHYEVSQSRNRLIFIGVRKDLNIEPSYPVPSKDIITIKQAIGHLDNIQNKKIDHIWIDESPEGRNTKTWHLANNTKSDGKYCMQFKRENWNKPASTILGGGFDGIPYLRSSNCHPLYTRTFSILEVKILNSFPENFKLNGTFGMKNTVLGNCVPPNFMKHIALHIKNEILKVYYDRRI